MPGEARPRVGHGLRREEKKLNPRRFLEWGMDPWNPKAMWRRVQRSVRDWMEPEDVEPDPSVLFHLTFTMPLVIGVLLALRQL